MATLLANTLTQEQLHNGYKIPTNTIYAWKRKRQIDFSDDGKIIANTKLSFMIDRYHKRKMDNVLTLPEIDTKYGLNYQFVSYAARKGALNAVKIYRQYYVADDKCLKNLVEDQSTICYYTDTGPYDGVENSIIEVPVGASNEELEKALAEITGNKK